MGIVSKRYGDACGIARQTARNLLARPTRREPIENAVETFVAALHDMPPWALRAIADKIDPELPET